MGLIWTTEEGEHDAMFINQTSLTIQLCTPLTKNVDVKPGGKQPFKYRDCDAYICIVNCDDFKLAVVCGDSPSTSIVINGEYVVNRIITNSMMLVEFSHNARLNAQIVNQSTRRVTLFTKTRDCIIVDPKSYVEYSDVNDISTDLGTKIGYLHTSCDIPYTFDNLTFLLQAVDTTAVRIIITGE